MERDLLLVAYEFPPKGGTAAQQVVKLARGLTKRGWRVHVLTVRDPPTSMRDDSLKRETGDLAGVTATFSLEPTRLVQAARRLRDFLHCARVLGRGKVQAGATPVGPAGPGGSGSAREAASRVGAVPGAPRGYTSLPRWAIRAIQAFFLPDEKVGWAPWAVRAAVRLHRDRPFAVVLSTGPPFTAHAIARRVAGLVGIPWVADLRDPIVDGYFFKPFTPLHDLWMQRFEARLVGQADLVTVATRGMLEELAARHGGLLKRALVLPNSFDREHFPHLGRSPTNPPSTPPPMGPAGSDDGKFTIAYVGTFQATIRPDVFLEAVRLLAEECASFASAVQVRLVGPLDTETGRTVSRHGLETKVLRTGFVPHSDAVAEMLRADVLLLVLGPERESRAIQTSKLPEYLAAGRPVLALVPDGVAAETVRLSGAGEVVEPLDVRGAVDALRRLFDAWRVGALRVPDPALVRQFDQDALMERLDAELAQLAPVERRTS